MVSDRTLSARPRTPVFGGVGIARLDAALVLAALATAALLLTPVAGAFDEPLSVAFARLGPRDAGLLAALILTIGLSAAWFVRRRRPVWAVAAAALLPALVALTLTAAWAKVHFYVATFIMLVLFRANHGPMRRPLRLRDLPILMFEPVAVLFAAGDVWLAKRVLVVGAALAVAAAVVERREGKPWTRLKTPLVLAVLCLALCAPTLRGAPRLDAISVLSAAGIAYCGFLRGALHLRQLPLSILTMTGAALCSLTHYGYGERLIIASSLAMMVLLVGTEAARTEAARTEGRRAALTTRRATVRVATDPVGTRGETPV